jgi:threonine/homoserine efflux transporter RhtA
VVSPTRTGLLFALEPVAAVGFGIAWLGETLGPRQAAGAAAILLGVVIGEAGRDREAAPPAISPEDLCAGYGRANRGGRSHDIA